jgi:cytochrome P450
MSTHDDQEELLSESAVRDPYSFFGRLRESNPVVYNERYRSWVLTRYDDISAAFKDPRFGSDRITPYQEQRRAQGREDASDAVFSVLADWLVFKDPPDHGRLRRLVHRAFTPRAVQQMEVRIKSIAAELLRELPTSGEIDLIRGFAYPLPAIVIAEMLGVPPSDRDLFKRWSDDLSALVFGGLEDDGRYERATTGMLELVEYLNELIDRYTDDPAENLISALVRARDEGDSLTNAEVVATCTLLLFGGHETTTNLIGNSLLALVQHAEALEQLQDEPESLRVAIEEFLRYDGPAKAVARVMVEDAELRGRRLQRGERVFLVTAAGNRDPRAFPRPDALDVTREGAQHLGFGLGVHYCLGAPLARMEALVALRALIEGFEELELAADQLRWHPVLLNRGLIELPLRYRRREVSA